MADNNAVRLNKLIESYRTSNNLEILTELVEELRNSMVHLPCRMDAENKVSAAIIKTQNGKSLIPIFTDKEQLQGHVPNGTRVAVLPYLEVNKLAFNEARNHHLDGIVINPATSNITFNVNLINKLQQTEEEGAKKGEKLPLDLHVEMPKLDNSGIVDQMESFAKENNLQVKQAILNNLLNSLRTAAVAVPAGVNKDGKDCPLIVTLKTTNEKFFPVFMDPELAKEKHPGCKIGIFSFDKAVEICLSMKQEVEGMVLVSANVSVNLKTKLLENVKVINSRLDDNKKEKSEDMQAVPRGVLEQAKFSTITLPGLLERRGQRFIDELLERKAAFIDELYENSYFDIRQYPYVVEEFAVTAISAAPTIDAIEIEFPRKDIGVGCAVRAYIIWDNATMKGRYFGICKNADDAHMIIEFTNGARVNHGMAVIESNEMSRILDIVGI